MTAPNWKHLFSDHLQTLQKTTEECMQRWGFDQLVIDAGSAFTHFNDDQDAPFEATPTFKHWCPLNQKHHLIEFRLGEHQPRLLHYLPKDFWHLTEPLKPDFWTDSFKTQSYETIADLWRSLTPNRKGVYIGPHQNIANQFSLAANPSKFVHMLNWHRALKSPYEVACIREANRIASKGHEAAKQAFLEGLSERQIHFKYLQATEHFDHELPYNAIIGLDQHAAVLHYEYKATRRGGRVLLIDAGARFQNYCSDITRTFVHPEAHPVFKDLLQSMDRMQQRLCQEVQDGTPYPELHHKSHQYLCEILVEHHLVAKVDVAGCLDKGFSRVFYPHGLGHQLGVQVHDVGGDQQDPYGHPGEPPQEYPRLRTTRTLTQGMVTTIEPGLYFIPILLDQQRSAENASYFNWKLIDELIPMGGIRIEDNVAIGDQGPVNITREFLD